MHHPQLVNSAMLSVFRCCPVCCLGTLLVKDKSHKMHQDFFHTVSHLSPEQLANIPDHYQFTPEQLPYWNQFDTVKLKGGAGSLFLWDSRTTHSVSKLHCSCVYARVALLLLMHAQIAAHLAVFNKHLKLAQHSFGEEAAPALALSLHACQEHVHSKEGEFHAVLG